ncbi:MAG: hypothetical protein ACP5TE_13030 [Verrucomicrobiia bacterium]|jgi:hypothetical protein
MIKLFIFECNDETEAECFERGLFGSKSKWPLYVHKGDFCFLYNYYGRKQLIYGVYQAICDGAANIVNEAWGGRYPFQVRIEQCSKERISVPRYNIEHIVTNPDTGRVNNILKGDLAQNLIQFFAGGYTFSRISGEKLADIEEDIRQKYPRKYHCTDGHDVRSLSEQSIDDWLSSHQVYHEYERLTNIPEYLIPDFTVYSRDKSPVFIEFWGMLDNPLYLKRRELKCNAYLKHQCKLIELYTDDLKNLDFSLRNKLKKFDVEVK